MSAALKHSIHAAALGLLVAGLSGCGTANPVSPINSSLVAAPTTETTVATMPMEEELPPGGETIATIISFEDRTGNTDSRKKPKKDNPGRHRGWDETP